MAGAGPYRSGRSGTTTAPSSHRAEAERQTVAHLGDPAALSEQLGVALG